MREDAQDPTGDGDREQYEELDVLVAHCAMAPRLIPVLESTPGLRVCASPSLDENADVVVGFHFPPNSLARLGRLRWLHLTGTGVDHLPATGLPPGVLVTNSAAVPVEAVAEYAVSGLLLILKDLPDVVQRHDAPWFTSKARMLAGSTAAVIGTGRIGRALLARLTALGARTVAVNRTGTPVPEAHRSLPSTALWEEAPGFDHLLACLPASRQTQGLICARVLTLLPPHATVVNVGRSETIDNATLHRQLHQGRLLGAFIDVHEREPLAQDDQIWQVPNLVVSPHRAFAFPGEPEAVARTFLANLSDLRAGRSPQDRVLPLLPEGERS